MPLQSRLALIKRLKSIKAEYSTSTIWPEGFDPEAAGAVLVD